MVTDPASELLMLEPTAGYFESLRHTMVGLQTSSPHRCLLSSYLFETKPDSISAPEYLRKTDSGEPSTPCVVKSLDESQRLAFQKATTEEVALIQGPPGTGKTFTTNVILQSLVDTLNPQDLPTSPVVVVAQTNHAVDQLLKKYIDDRGSDTVVRLGGRGSDEMKSLSLRERMFTSSNFRGQSMGQSKTKLQKIIKCLQDASDQVIDEVDATALKNFHLISAAQYDSIADDDGWESSETLEQEKGNSPLLTWLGDTFQRPTPCQEQMEDQVRERRQHGAKICFLPLQDSSAALPKEDYAKYLLENYANLYDIKLEKRPEVYQYLATQLRDILNPRSGVVELLASYTEACESVKLIRETNQVQFIQQGGFKVIACTATGLLKYRKLISRLRPRVLLMEEAAEIREADTIAACLCFPTLEHLILLGDHQQLQPHANLHELSEDPYRINISMFERLIKVGISHQTLLEQRRMIPPLRRIVQLFYPNVIDSPSISKLCTDVPGVPKPLWWFQHDWQETRSQIGSDCTSIENGMEARMMVLFVQYLVDIKNIHPRRITMLTFYNGQVRLIKGELARNPCFAARSIEWSVRTVDGFQGEENDIILLSLVRGPNGVPGFLSSSNRAIVALSRARLGLYIFGHKDVLLRYPKSRKTWSNVVHEMQPHSGRTMHLCVDGEEVRVGRLDDWKAILRKGRSTTSCETTQDSQSDGEVGEISPGRSCSGRSFRGASPFETEAELSTATANAMTTTGDEEPALPARPAGPPPGIPESLAETLTADSGVTDADDDADDDADADAELICLADAVTVPLPLHALDMGSISLDTPVMALEAGEEAGEVDEPLIQFPDDDDVVLSREPPTDLLD
ncbi:hypothetical protein E4U41_007629 [Claviceps citrina]|nr:hypothetical protein E4U41_007629 [Claviceps citrina]